MVWSLLPKRSLYMKFPHLLGIVAIVCLNTIISPANAENVATAEAKATTFSGPLGSGFTFGVPAYSLPGKYGTITTSKIFVSVKATALSFPANDNAAAGIASVVVTNTSSSTKSGDVTFTESVVGSVTDYHTDLATSTTDSYSGTTNSAHQSYPYSGSTFNGTKTVTITDLASMGTYTINITVAAQARHN